MDLDYVRERFRELDTEELRREALLNADDFHPDALDVLTEELRSQGATVHELLADGLQRSGELVARIDDVRRFLRKASFAAPAAGPAKGYFVLTTQGMGFVATKLPRPSCLADQCVR